MQSPGHRAANQGADTQLHHAERLLDRQVFRQRFVRFTDNLSRLGLDDVYLLCRIEDRLQFDCPSMQMLS